MCFLASFIKSYMGRGIVVGELLETTLERVPLLRLRHNLVDKSWDDEGVEWYRRIMTSLGDKVVGEKLQQRFIRLSFHMRSYEFEW